MRVVIDGYEYVPKPDTFNLTPLHFSEAAKLSNSFELIQWAFETQSGVPEMLAWGRNNGATEAEPEKPPEPPAKPKKAAPLVMHPAKPKAKPSLFATE